MCAVTAGAGQGTIPWKTGINAVVKINVHNCDPENGISSRNERSKKHRLFVERLLKNGPGLGPYGQSFSEQALLLLSPAAVKGKIRRIRTELLVAAEGKDEWARSKGG
jgi:hypothetical protein